MTKTKPRPLIAAATILLAGFAGSGPIAARTAPADPFAWPYNQPTAGVVFDAGDVFQAWQEWKSAQISSANAGGGGRLRVMGGVNGFSTVSEGQGYGILFASIFDDQRTLDGLWLFTADHLNAHGLMDWHVGNPGQRLGRGAATDADEDMALGLLNACVKVREGSWPASPAGIDYCARTGALVGAIYRHEIDAPGEGPSGGLSSNRGHELLPGDQWTPEVDYPAGIVNLSYFAPGFYTVFGKFTGNEAAWQAVNDRNYELVDLAQQKPGNCSNLVPNWIQYDGDAQQVPWQPQNYAWWSYDAARLAWRVAVDKVWYRTADARETMNEIGSFFSSVGLGRIGEHTMSGQLAGGGPFPFFVSNAGTSIWAADRLTPVACGGAEGRLRESPQSAYNRVLASRDTPNSYYGNAWRLFALLLMTGNFPNFYEMSADDGSVPPAPDPGEPVPPRADIGSCTVNYAIASRWDTGFHATVRIVNLGSRPIAGYTLAWSVASGERITSGWNATFTQNGPTVTASNPAGHWNGTIRELGGSVEFGFIAAGVPATPARFLLNGIGCGV